MVSFGVLTSTPYTWGTTLIPHGTILVPPFLVPFCTYKYPHIWGYYLSTILVRTMWYLQLPPLLGVLISTILVRTMWYLQLPPIDWVLISTILVRTMWYLQVTLLCGYL